jgi:hypothetical protein
VRFRSEEVGSSSARGRRSYTHASTKGVHSGDARQLEAEPSLSLLCLKLDLCLKLNSWYSSYICCSQKMLNLFCILLQFLNLHDQQLLLTEHPMPSLINGSNASIFYFLGSCCIGT